MKFVMVVDLPDNVNADRVTKTPVQMSFLLDADRSIKQLMYADGYLKPMPHSKQMENRWFSDDYSKGWNDCLREIEQ